jgi:hypothetical protein
MSSFDREPLRRVLGTRSDGHGGKLITLACGHVIRSPDGLFTTRMACPECAMGSDGDEELGKVLERGSQSVHPIR